MNLAELTAAIQAVASGEHIDVDTILTSLINEAVLEIATDFHLPYLKSLTPTILDCAVDQWLYDMPATYHKNLFMVRDSDYTQICITTMEALQERDWDHDETGDHVTTVAVNDKQIGIYPMANENIKLWFYKLPTDLEFDDDELLCIPKEFHRRLVVPKILLKVFDNLMDMAIEPPAQSVMYWQMKYEQGLHGTPRGDVGFYYWLARHAGDKPKRYLRRDHLGA